MDLKDELSELFRNNEHKLDETPSPQTWQRLERRLDARRAKSRQPIFRMYRLAAAVAALVVLVTAIALWLPSLNAKKQELAANAMTPQSWEFLHSDSNEDEVMYQIVQVSYQQHRQLDDPIAEGAPTKRLNLQPAVSEKLNHTRIGNRSEIRGNRLDKPSKESSDSLIEKSM
ncbi:MAG: hypothetical protein AAF990_00885 [Bacteroidota bacterium]